MLLKSLNFRRLYNTFFLIPPKKGIKRAKQKAKPREKHNVPCNENRKPAKKKKRETEILDSTHIPTQSYLSTHKYTDKCDRKNLMEKAKRDSRRQTAGRECDREGDKQTVGQTDGACHFAASFHLSSVQFSSVRFQLRLFGSISMHCRHISMQN